MLFQASYSIAPIMLALAIKSESSKQMVIFCFGYLFLNFLPYFLSYISNIFLTKWKLLARLQISKDIQRRYENQYHLLNQIKLNNKYKAILSNNSQELLIEIIDYIYKLFSFFSSSLFSLLFISIFIIHEILLTYLISFICSCIIILLTRKRQTYLSRRTERSKNKFIGNLADSWGNNILSQDPFWENQKNIINRHWNLFRINSLYTINFFQKTSIIQAIVIWLPTSVLVLYSIGTSSLLESAALIVVLPRIVELLLDISNLVMRALEFNLHRGRLTWLEHETSLPGKKELEHHVNFKEISIQNPAFGSVKVNSLCELTDLIEQARGRIQISGANGSGKTTLLTLLKHHYADEAFLLPSNTSMLTVNDRQKSTGQLRLSEIEIIKEHAILGKYSIILLDEWNAHLDSSNYSYIDDMLNEISQNTIIVEVIHWKKDTKP